MITPDCSMALLIAPLCGLGMVLIRPRRAQVRRAAKALAVASLVMVAGDLVRIGSIAMTIRLDGIDTGYQISNLMLGRPAASYLDAQRGAHLQRMRELTDLKRGGNLIDIMLADHGLYHLEADLRWIDHTIARLDALREAVRK